MTLRPMAMPALVVAVAAPDPGPHVEVEHVELVDNVLTVDRHRGLA